MKEEDRPKLVSLSNSILNRLVGKNQRRENMEDIRERAMCLSPERDWPLLRQKGE